MKVDQKLDAKGLACPMPIVKTKKAMNELNPGEILEVATTDAGAKQDLTAWSSSTGHTLLEDTEDQGVYTFWIQKG